MVNICFYFNEENCDVIVEISNPEAKINEVI